MTDEHVRTKNYRIPLIDFVRGFAVLLMVAYHTAYFLDFNGLADVPLFESDFWFNAPRVIVTLFMLCSGASLYISCRHGIRWTRYLKRFGYLAGLAGLITLGTFVFFRTSYIFSGILHCAAGASLLVLPVLLIRSDKIRPWAALFLGTALVILSRLGLVPDFPPHVEGVISMDYIPFIPWAAPVFIGIFFGYLLTAVPAPGKDKSYDEIPGTPPPHARFYTNLFSKAVLFLGRRSLWAYFIHIAVIFAATMGVARLIN